MSEGDGREPDRGSRAAEEACLAAVLPPAGRDAADVLSAVVRISPLAMVLTDANVPDFPVVFCNRAFVRLTGYAEEETVGRNCRFLQGPDTDPASVDFLRDTVRAGGEAQVDLWNYRKDGSRFWNSMFVGPVRDADGRLLYYFGSQIDSSARRAAEEAANRERRMDSLGAMAAGLAHEVNNLMTVVIGNVEGLRKTVVAEGPAERLGRIDWAARSAGKLTQQMLSFAGRQGLQAEAVDLNAVLRGAEYMLGQVASSTSSIELALHPVPLLAEVDAGQLELALINLVRNAADASEAGGKIVVAAAAQHEDGVAWAVVSVSDRGSGMSATVAAKAMDPFFTTKAHGRGTGLGLSMVAGFCRESGGRMRIETEAGRGTTINLAFPLLTS